MNLSNPTTNQKVRGSNPLQRANRKPLCIKGLRYFFSRFSKFKNLKKQDHIVFEVFLNDLEEEVDYFRQIVYK